MSSFVNIRSIKNVSTSKLKKTEERKVPPGCWCGCIIKKKKKKKIRRVSRKEEDDDDDGKKIIKIILIYTTATTTWYECKLSLIIKNNPRQEFILEHGETPNVSYS